MKPYRVAVSTVALAALLANPSPAAAQTDPAPVTALPDAFPVTIRVDAGKPIGELKPIWRMFGADEPNYATMPNGRKLIGELGAMRPGDVFFRAHNLLCTGNGTPALKWGSTGVYNEDADGKPIYDWTILDSIFDTYLTNGVRPYAQIGFMPKDLSTKPEPYQHNWNPDDRYSEIFTGWAYPPKDYEKWAELVYQWVKHCLARYGRAEVEKWYWEVWNEPNIGYWKGTQEEFIKLHDYAIDAVRRALPTARVGGPDTAGSGGSWMRTFLNHCLRGTNYATGKVGTPMDFVSFHAKGSPSYVSNHVRMGIANELRTIDEGFGIIASYPEFKNLPIVIGECDPEGCAACQGNQLGYRNGTMYSSYTAASFGRMQEMADRHGVNLDAALTWAFTFEGYPPFAGFRQVASYGINHPVLNVFKLFSKMDGQRISASSDAAVPLDAIIRNGVRQAPDVSALAARGTNQLTALVWHYHDEDLPGPVADVALSIAGLPAGLQSAMLKEFRIDADHSNAYEVWKKMSSPQQPSAAQLAELEKAAQLATLPGLGKLPVAEGNATIRIRLPRQAVSLVVVQW
jgi:xylan 1,4-beta-xylosidase